MQLFKHYCFSKIFMNKLYETAVFIFIVSILFVSNNLRQHTKYKEQEVRFVSGEAELAGTLFIPESNQNFPAVIITHGAGPDSRKSIV